MVQQIVNNISTRDCSYCHHLIVMACTSSHTIVGERLLQDLRRWLAPPDPSTNHNIACTAQHERTAAWVFNEDIFKEWESSGALLWIHGKGVFSRSGIHMRLTAPGFVAGSGKSILWFGVMFSFRIEAYVLCQLCNHPASHHSAQCWDGLRGLFLP